MNITNKNKGYLADLTLFIVALVWGAGFVAAKDGLNHFPPLALMAYRFIIASIIMGVVFHKRLRKIVKEDIKKGFILGFFNFGGFAAQTIGLLYTTVAKQGMFTALYVIFVPFLVWIIYKKSPGIRIFVSAFVAVIGIFLMSYNDLLNLHLNIGDALTILSAACYALGIIYVDHALKTVEAMKLTFLQLVGTASLLTICSLIFEDAPSGLEISSFYSLFYLAIFSTFICYVLQVNAQKYTAPSRASLIMSLESLFAVIFGIILLNERIDFVQTLGIVILFSATLLVELGPRRKAGLRKSKIKGEA